MAENNILQYVLQMDASGGLAKLAEFQRALQALDGKDINLDVNAGDVERLKRAINDLSLDQSTLARVGQSVQATLQKAFRDAGSDFPKFFAAQARLAAAELSTAFANAQVRRGGDKEAPKLIGADFGPGFQDQGRVFSDAEVEKFQGARRLLSALATEANANTALQRVVEAATEQTRKAEDAKFNALGRQIIAINKRTEAEEEARRRVQQTADAFRQASTLGVSFPDATADTPLGKKQVAVNVAERRFRASYDELRRLPDQPGLNASDVEKKQAELEARRATLASARADLERFQQDEIQKNGNVQVKALKENERRDIAAARQAAADDAFRNFKEEAAKLLAGVDTGTSIGQAKKKVVDALLALQLGYEREAQALSKDSRTTATTVGAARSILTLKDRLAQAEANLARAEANPARLAEVDRQANLADVPYPSARNDSFLGRAQTAVNRSQTERILAENNLATVMSNEARTTEDVIRARQRLRNALANEALASERVRVASAAPPSGLVEQFKFGFRGASDVPFAQQTGQAFKFAVLYGTAYKALFAFTQTLQQTVQEGIEFQTAVSELKLATGRSTEEATRLANELGQTAVNAGFAPSEGALTGARAIGLYGATEADTATQNAIARISTEVGTKLAFNSGQKIEDVQTRLAAITNAFQLGPSGQGQVADLDSFLSKKFGVAPGATIRTVAEVGSVGQSAGFDLNQVSSIAALIMGRTGQTDSAVAGQLAQIFSRGGEGSLTAVASRYGIDTQATLAEQLRGLSEVYKTATPTQQNEIAAAFGRGRVQNTISILLGSFDDVSKAADEAASGLAKGASDAAFSERINNIGGQLQLLLADFKEFANLLGQSGVLSALGLMVKGLTELLEATNTFLRIWNEVPGAIRNVIASLALLALASRTRAGQEAAGAATSFLFGGSGGVFRSAGGKYTKDGSPIAAGRLGIIAGEKSAPLFSRAGLSVAGSAAGAAALASAPFAAAAGGIYALAELAESTKSFQAALNANREALEADTSDLKTPDQLRASAAALREAAKKTDSTGLGGQLAGLSDLITGNGGAIGRAEKESRSQLIAEAKRREAQAKILESQPVVPGSTLLPLDKQGLSDGLERLALAGASARQSFEAVRDSLLGSGEAARRATASFDPKEFSARLAGALPNDAFSKDLPQSDKGNFTGLNADFNRSLVQKRLPGILKELGVKSASDLTGDKLTQLPELLLGDQPAFTDKEIGNLPVAGGLSNLRQSLTNLVIAEAGKLVADTKQVVAENRALTQEEMRNGIEQLKSQADAALAALPENDLAGRIAILKDLKLTIVERIKKNRSFGVNASEQDIIDLQGARKALLEAQFEEAQRVLQIAQQNAGSNAAAARLGDSFVTTQIKAAVDAGAAGTDLLVKIIADAGKGARLIAKNAIASALKVARQALADARRASAFSIIPGLSGLIGNDPNVAKSEQRIKELEAQKQALESAVSGGSEGIAGGFGTDFPGFKDAKASADDAKRKAASIKNSLRLLSIDLTDPLAEARVAVQEALDRLRNATDREEKLAARVDVRRARNNLEATKFQQRLESVQTAEELGRISHSKYINYLENEKKRLERIGKRTYQQQQQLDQVDRLLKSAGESISGQFNFGDIKLPTPYEVRRRVQELYTQPGVAGVNAPGQVPAAQTGTTNNQTVTIQINGADVQRVRQVVSEYLSSNTITRTTRPSNR